MQAEIFTQPSLRVKSFSLLFQSKLVNAGGSCWIGGNCLQRNSREAKAVETVDSLGLNHAE